MLNKRIKTINKNGIKEFIFFENEYYKLRIDIYDSNYITAGIDRISNKPFLPSLFIRQDLDGNNTYSDITFGNYGTGSLTEADVKTMIESYQIAIESRNEFMEVLKDYLKPDKK